MARVFYLCLKEESYLTLPFQRRKIFKIIHWNTGILYANVKDKGVHTPGSHKSNGKVSQKMSSVRL